MTLSRAWLPLSFIHSFSPPPVAFTGKLKQKPSDKGGLKPFTSTIYTGSEHVNHSFTKNGWEIAL